jgi:hypothetical protein
MSQQDSSCFAYDVHHIASCTCREQSATTALPIHCLASVNVDYFRLSLLVLHTEVFARSALGKIEHKTPYQFNAHTPAS